MGAMIELNRTNGRWPNRRSKEGFHDKALIEQTITSLPIPLHSPGFPE
jgi:hypothetical protein